MPWLTTLRTHIPFLSHNNLKRRKSSRPSLKRKPTPMPSLNFTPPSPSLSPIPFSTSSTSSSPPTIPPTPILQPMASLPPPTPLSRPVLEHVPTDIVIATEKGMISGAMCCTSASTCMTPTTPTEVGSVEFEMDGEEKGSAYEEKEYEMQMEGVLTRGEEACRGVVEGFDEREKRRSVLFKGVDV